MLDSMVVVLVSKYGTDPNKPTATYLPVCLSTYRHNIHALPAKEDMKKKKKTFALEKKKKRRTGKRRRKIKIKIKTQLRSSRGVREKGWPLLGTLCTYLGPVPQMGPKKTGTGPVLPVL